MTIHSIELNYVIASVDVADALVTWSEFYNDCKRRRFTKDGIRAIIRYYYPKLSRQIAWERDLKPSHMANPTDALFDNAATIVYEHYQEEREVLNNVSTI